MIAIGSGGDLSALEAEIARCVERGDHEAADALRRHLAKLEAMRAQSELANGESGRPTSAPATSPASKTPSK